MATITAAAGGGNWNVGSTWVGGVVPLTTDDVVLNATSGQVTITATAQCKDINFSGYTNTITFNANLTITGNLTRNTSVFSYLGTGGIIIAGTTTQIINSSTVAWNIPVTIGGVSPNITINSAFNITAPLTLSSTTSPVISRANVFDLTENVHPSGNITISGNGTYTGSANIVVSGSNNQTLTASGSHQIRNNLTIDKTGGVLSLSGTLNYNTGTLAYVASGGTVNAGTSTLNITTSTTLNTTGMSWNNIVIAWGAASPSAVSITVTLSSDLSLLGNLTLNGNAFPANMTFAGSGNISCSGNLAINQLYNGGSVTLSLTLTNTLNATNLTTSAPNTFQYFTLNGGNMNLSGGITLGNVYAGILGTTNINLIGTGTINCGSGVSISSIRNNLTINTLGTITLGGTLVYNTGTLTYIQGTMVYNSNILNIANSQNVGGAISCSLSGNANWFSLNITPATSATVTLLSDIGTQNLVTSTNSVTINGLFNINVSGNLTVNTTTSGTSTILINGNSSQTWSGISYLSNNLTINKANGSIIIGANVYYRTGTLTYNNIGGTVDATTNLSTLNIGGNTTLNTNGITWYNFACNTTSTITLSSNLAWSNLMTLANGGTTNVTFSGSALSPSVTATMSLGHANYNTNTGNTSITFPSSTVLNLQSLTIQCGGASGIGYNCTINNAAFNVSGNLTCNFNGQALSYVLGTSSSISMIGSGTISFSGTNGAMTIQIPFNINTVGAYNFTGLPFFSSNVNYITGTLTGVSCYFFTGANLNFTAGLKWGTSVIMRGNITLSSNVIFGNLTTDTTAVSLSGAFNVNVEGNLAINIATGGTNTPIVLNGTGNQSWTHGSAVYISNNITINKPSGTLTLGANVYYTVGTLTYTQGDVDVTTNNNTFFVTGGTYNVEGINFNTFYFATSGVNSITLASNLYARTFTCGGNSTINGAFDIYCLYFNMNNSSTGQISASLSFPRTIYCAIDATFSGATATNACTFTGNLYVGGSCYHNAASTGNQGAANLFMVGNGELRAPSIATTFISNLYFNTSGKVTITGNISYAFGAARTINLIRGNIDARKATLNLNRAFTHTLTNINKMVWGNVVLDTVSALTLNMNEFFCGDATTQTNITTNTTTNAIVTFTDNFEKIAKFVNINGITFTRPQQLLLLTNQPKKSRNRGIRYNNDLPNGISKNDPSVQNQMAYSVPKYLIGDPSMIKSI